MNRSLGLLLLPVACAALSGCLANVPAKEDSPAFSLPWREDFEAARRDAAESGKPMLVVIVAGALRDKC